MRRDQQEALGKNISALQPRRHLLDGTTWVFLAEALILPAGLVIVMFLTRKLGPQGYGLFALSAAFVTWIEVSISSIFSRATVKFISETTDWRPVGDVVMRLHLMVSLGAALLLFFSAKFIGSLLNEPLLATYLRLFALDIPFFNLASALRYVLIGLGSFRQRAVMTAGQSVTRLILILMLVELGLSVPGAILGSIGASLVGMSSAGFMSIFHRSVVPPFLPGDYLAMPCGSFFIR